MSDKLSETVWKGAKAVELIAEQAPDNDLAEAAKRLSEELYAPGRGGPIVAYIASRGDKAVEPRAQEAMEAFVEAVKPTSPKYDQPVFQCYADFEKCKASGTSTFMCGLMLALCYAERVIPLAGLSR